MLSTQESLLQRIEWCVLKRLDGQLQGDYRTLFRGSGVVFADLREYQASDDVRHIDWSVTARMQTPFVKVHHEDREISAWFVVDVSPSMDFASSAQSKRALAIDVVAVLASLLAKRGNRVGALVYSAQSTKADLVVPTGQVRRHVLQLLHRLGAVGKGGTEGPVTKAQDATTQLHHLLAQTDATAKRRASVFVVSDFLSTDSTWQDNMARLARRHDVVAIQIGDPAEHALPQGMGMLVLQDAETGEQVLIDGNDAALRQRFMEAAQARQVAIAEALSRAGCTHLSLLTDQDLAAQLIQFVRLRKTQTQRSVTANKETLHA